MRYSFNTPACLLSAVLLLAWMGCDSSDVNDEPGTVTVALTHSVNGSDLMLNAVAYTNAAGNRYEVTRLEYVITDLALQKEDGGTVELASSHYRNLEEADTHEIVVTDIPAGAYTGLVFTFGVEGGRNVFGTLPNTAAYNNMLWPAQLGGGTDRYHNMRLEGRYQRDDGSMAGFLTHTGPTDGNDNAIMVSLPLRFEVTGTTTSLQVEMDVNEWFVNPMPYNFADYTGMIMGNQGAQTILKANGASVFSVELGAVN